MRSEKLERLLEILGEFSKEELAALELLFGESFSVSGISRRSPVFFSSVTYYKAAMYEERCVRIVVLYGPIRNKVRLLKALCNVGSIGLMEAKKKAELLEHSGKLEVGRFDREDEADEYAERFRKNGLNVSVDHMGVSICVDFQAIKVERISETDETRLLFALKADHGNCEKGRSYRIPEYFLTVSMTENAEQMAILSYLNSHRLCKPGGVGSNGEFHWKVYSDLARKEVIESIRSFEASISFGIDGDSYYLVSL